MYATAYTQTAPNLVVADMEGKTHNLYEYLDAGKSVLLDFFITDCIPCQDGAKYMNEFWIFGCHIFMEIFRSISFLKLLNFIWHKWTTF